jgi:hypothetical protein
MLASCQKGKIMARKRNHQRPALSLQDRLTKFVRDTRDAARKLPPGTERHLLLQKARNGEAAAELERWLSSPGLESPK